MNRSIKIKTLCDNKSHIGEEFGNSGFSLYIEVTDNKERTTRILFDTGLTMDHLSGSSKIQGIDLSKIDCIVLSHGHFDHTGGLGFIQNFKNKTKLFSHPHTFYQKLYKKPDGSEMEVGIKNEIRELIREKCDTNIRDRKSDIVPGIWITGEIKRINKHEIIDGHLRDVTKLIGNSKVFDELTDDISLVLELGEEEQILICGCCHSGIVNTLHHIEQYSCRNTISIIGGLQLHQSGSDQLKFTTDKLKELPLKEISPIHSSGEIGINHLKDEFREAYKAGGVGISYKYSS